MNLRELIELLHGQEPSSAYEANVIVCTATTDASIVDVRYSEGEVKIEVDDLPTARGYDKGYEDGLKAGREEAEDDD